MANEPNEEVYYTEDELSQGISASTESEYYRQAQDWSNEIRRLRIMYLCLKPKTIYSRVGGTPVEKEITDENGNTRTEIVLDGGEITPTTVYFTDKNRKPGINREGMEATIDFLIPRLHKHILMSSWNYDRMMFILKDDMHTWVNYMIFNSEKYELDMGTFDKIRTDITILIESAYSRGINNEERDIMRPVREILKAIGLDRSRGYENPDNVGAIDRIERELKPNEGMR